MATVRGGDRLRRQFRNFTPAVVTAASRGVRAGALIIEADAKQSIRQPGSGRVYGRHRASAPGEPPASDTGRLLGSVETVLFDSGLVAEVGTGVEYGGHLEFGTVKMAPRPWLLPAFRRNIDRVRNIIASQVRRAVR